MSIFRQLLFVMIVLVATPVFATTVSKATNGNDSILFSQKVFDTPTIIPRQFAAEHALSYATDYAKELCQLPNFQCVKVQPGDTWVKLFPDPDERNIIMRLNRTNVALKYRSWFLVPRDWNNLDFMALSPLPLHINTDGHRQLVIDLTRFAFGAYNRHGDLVHWGPASGGRRRCPLSNQACTSAMGDFKVYRKRGADCYSRTYPLASHGGAPMPYCMFYHAGYAIHASTLSGFFNHSRGCIRLFYDDAKWLNTEFAHIGTRVVVR